MTATVRLGEGSAAPVLARMWWTLMLRGIVIILFGALALFWLGESISGLAMLFAAYALIDGVLSVIGAIRGGGISARSGLALAGATSIVAAAVAALWPGVTASTLALIIGLWAIVRGALEFGSAIKLRQVMQRDWSLAMIGGFSVAFGLLVILYPFDPWTFVRMLSAYALIVGLLMILLAFRFLKPLRP